MRRCKLPLGAMLLALPCLGQTSSGDLPPGHPPTDSADRRQQLAAQTESHAQALPSAAGPVRRVNFIDDHILGKIERDGIPLAPLADDATFFRRVHLDMTGRIPTGAEARAFVADGDPDKRSKLVDRLVGSVDWRDRWTYWHLDLWRTSQNRVGWAGRNLFHDYVADALLLNQPYDEFVRELLTSEARSNWYVGPASYLDGAPFTNPGLVVDVFRYGSWRQRHQAMHFLLQLPLDQPVPPGDHLSDEVGVVVDSVEVAAAPEHQGLVNGVLQPVVSLLGDAVFMALAAVDAGGPQTVALQQGGVIVVEGPAAAAAHLVGGG